MRMETPTATCACEAYGLASAAKASTNRANNLVVRTISRTSQFNFLALGLGCECSTQAGSAKLTGLVAFNP